MFRTGTLFLLTNVAVLAVLAIVLQLLGVEEYLAQELGMPLVGTLIFCGIFGMAGAFISLALSKTLALRGTGAHVIKEPRNQTESWLLNTVHRQAREAGIGLPDVAIYDAPEMNAFATGMNRNSALVAVSTGLLRQMNADEVEAVLAHEVSHVANGDMVTMTLLQGVLNTFVLFLARVIGGLVDKVVFKNERGLGIGYFMVVLVAQVVLGILASIIVMKFSRWREFRADAGGAKLAGRGKMIAALQRLQNQHGAAELPESMEAMGIFGRKAGGFKRLFMSHPPLEERIAALQQSGG
jgi:heat shock protein HtpX